MNALRESRVIVAVVVLALVVAFVWRASAKGAGTETSSPLLQGDTPTPTPADTLTPTPDTEGYMPVPNVAATITSLEASSHADILVPMQAALDDEEADWFVALVDRPRLHVSAIGCVEGCGAELGVPDELTEIADEVLAGSDGLIQGYFESPDADPQDSSTMQMCLWVVAYRFGATIAYPTAPAGPPGGGNAESVVVDASAFEVCNLNDIWGLDDWRFGGYHEIVEGIATEYGLSPYFVIRP